MNQMPEKIYVLDTNIISALRPGRNPGLFRHVIQQKHHTLCLCEPVIFEIERGYEHRQASQQLVRFRHNLVPLFTVVSVRLEDWRVAAKLWGDARRRGYQLSDVDVLLAAMTIRLGAILVTDDSDFKFIPLVQTVNWLTGNSEYE